MYKVELRQIFKKRRKKNTIKEKKNYFKMLGVLFSELLANMHNIATVYIWIRDE